MTPQDEELYRLGYADALAGIAQRFERARFSELLAQQSNQLPAYLAGYRDGLADKTEPANA
jgi:hypothetical protein